MAIQNWIAMRTDLRHDPAVAKIAVRMKARVEVVIGYLHSVWCWADAATEDGIISGVTLDKAEELLSMPNFLHYMCEVGWLDYIEEPNGCQIVFPNWEIWMCNSTKKRLKQAKNKQLSRVDKKRTNVREMSPKTGTRCSSSCSSSSSSSNSSRSSSSKRKDPFDLWWETVHRKVGKGDARRAYPVAVKAIRLEKPDVDPHEFLRDRMTAYAASDLGKSQYAKHPASWLRGGHYDDDETAWIRSDGDDAEAAALARHKRYVAAEESRREAEETRRRSGRTGPRSDVDESQSLNQALNQITREL